MTLLMGQIHIGWHRKLLQKITRMFKISMLSLSGELGSRCEWCLQRLSCKVCSVSAPRTALWLIPLEKAKCWFYHWKWGLLFSSSCIIVMSLWKIKRGQSVDYRNNSFFLAEDSCLYRNRPGDVPQSFLGLPKGIMSHMSGEKMVIIGMFAFHAPKPKDCFMLRCVRCFVISAGCEHWNSPVT